MRRVKPTAVPEKPVSANIVRQHPSKGLAQAIIKWMDERKVPQSTVIKQAIFLAHSDVFDDRPLDFVRPEAEKLNIDSRHLVNIMNKLNEPNAKRVEVLAEILQSVWRNKKKPVDKKPVGKQFKSRRSA